MYEPKGHPPLPRKKFVRRFLFHVAAAFALLLGSLVLGMTGYEYFEHLAWRDAFLNAAMLLGGMGPVDAPRTDGGKLFAGLYAGTRAWCFSSQWVSCSLRSCIACCTNFTGSRADSGITVPFSYCALFIVKRPAGVRVIDVHAHYYPESYLALLKDHGYPAGTVYSDADPRKPDAPGAHTYKLRDRAFTDLELRIKTMDAQGVDVHALSIPPPYVFGRSAELLVRIARTFNDAASAAHRAYPERVVGLATLPVHEPQAAIEELERAAKLPGIRGVSLGTRFGERDLSDRTFLSALQTDCSAEAAGIPALRAADGDRLERIA